MAALQSPGAAEDWRWADAAALAGEVALPSAFQAFRGFLPKA